MSIAENLSSIESALAEAFVAVGEKGATIPIQKNLRNLISAISSVGIGSAVSPRAVQATTTVPAYIEENLEYHLRQAYTAIANKGGTVPTAKNFANLPAAIRSIPIVYGILTYKDAAGTTQTYELASTAEVDALCAPDLTTESWPIAVGGLSLTNTQVTGFELTALTGTLHAQFLANCSNLEEVKHLELATGVYPAFCYHCVKLNCPLTWPASDTALPTNFLVGCTSFNSSLTIPKGVKTIGQNFLYECTSFNQPIALPSTLYSVSHYFLAKCSSFNSPLTFLRSGSVTVGYAFLYNCTSFNQPIDTEQLNPGEDFMENCSSFNQPVTISDRVSTIPSSFLSGCSSFNSSITIPTSCTQINLGFLDGCNSFNQPLVLPQGLKVIGNSFMRATWSFVQPLVIPDSVETMYDSFMFGLRNFLGPLTVPSGITYSFSELPTALSGSENTPAYTQGVTITGPGASELIALLPNGKITGLPYYRNLKLG